MRTPSADERAQEAAFLLGNLADVLVTVLQIVAAVVFGSLTMLGEMLRGGLLTAISFFAWFVMRAIHRGRLSAYEYGAGKIEQLVCLVIGLSLLLGAVWVTSRVVGTIAAPGAAASPFGLAFAAVTNAVNLTINIVGWYAMYVAARDDHTGVFGTQLRVRFIMLLSTIILQVPLTIAALTRDQAVALGLDALGAVFVIGLMLKNGLPMVVGALNDLVDAPATNDLQDMIRAAAGEVVAQENVRGLRTRRSGRTTFAEVAIAPAVFATPAAIAEVTAAIEGRLELRGAPVSLRVVPARLQAGS